MNKNWHSQKADEALAALDSTKDGLTSDEAARRLAEHGYNELGKQDHASPWSLFFGQFKNVLIIILLVATVLSLIVGETVDALIIGIIVVFSALLGFVQEYRAERALEALKEMLHASITVLRDGREDKIDAREVVPGDIMSLEAGDKVPADGRIIQIASLQCDEAPLTGESVPVQKTLDPVPGDVPIGDRTSMVFTGSVVTYGRALAVVTSTGMNTEFGSIAREVASIKTDKTPLERRTEEIGKWLGIAALVICVLVIGISLAREYFEGTLNINSGIEMMMFGVALAVAAVPEALAAIVTGALAIGMREMAKRNALVRRMPAVETLGCTTVICTDKTGTLTKGEMTVRRVHFAGAFYDVEGAGYDPAGKVDGPTDEMRELLMCSVLCNDSALIRKPDGSRSVKGDPTEAALLVLAGKAGMDMEKLRPSHMRIDEVPFSSERKMMSVVVESPEGRRTVYAKGAPEVILAQAKYIAAAGGEVRPITKDDLDGVMSASEQMASEALRVLALAYKDAGAEKHDQHEDDLVFAGLVGMMDPPRPEAMDAVATCRRVHMKPVMITGDHKLTAMAVAREMGIYQDGDMALTGQELEAMSQEEFDAVVDKVSVYARVSPMDKLKIVTAWKHRGEIVAMTGDGVNDAPALKHADIGIAMGISGTEVAKEAADMVLSDDNFATIVAAIERGRWIYDNIKKYLTYLLRCNITEVLVIGGVVIVMGPEYLPLLPAAILYVNLATDGLPALALGVAPPDPDIMQRPPRNPSESVFTREVKAFILMAVIIEFPLFIWMFYAGLPDMELARTRMFFMFIVLELVIALNFRSMRYGLFTAPPHKWLWLALVWEVILIVVLIQIPGIRDSFGVGIPSKLDMIEIGAFAVLVMTVMEIVKYVMRKRAAATL